MNQLKSIYNSPFKDLHSHPIHTCFPINASNEKRVLIWGGVSDGQVSSGSVSHGSYDTDDFHFAIIHNFKDSGKGQPQNNCNTL